MLKLKYDIPKIWNRLFLEERPSLSLSAFRIAVALTVGFVMLPTFVHLGETYLPTAFKTHNSNFFPVSLLEWVYQSPEWLIYSMVGVFCVAWFCFLIGFFSQLSCIATLLCCYYFYALNYFAMGTLSWDILLVTLFLMCLTPYHGDYFSVDVFRRKHFERFAFKRPRPYFLQRLLQLQIGFTFFYTALHKATMEGNWLLDNPIHSLMLYPGDGVVKWFMIKEVMAAHPTLCYWIGITIVLVEFLLMFLLFWRKTRVGAICLGVMFHFVLILTLDVPATFFFLFPPMLLLFIDPKDIVHWIDRERQFYKDHPKYTVIFPDGNPAAEKRARQWRIMDLFGKLHYRAIPEYFLHSVQGLNPEKDNYILVRGEEIYKGFDVYRILARELPMMYLWNFVLYLPGAKMIWKLFHRKA